MLRTIILFLLIGTQVLLTGTQAGAGPWPRGKGKVFYSVHANVEMSEGNDTIRQYGSIYGEYGLTDRLTLGIDYSGSEISTDKAIAFLRIPIPNGDRQLRFAAELGLGLSGTEMALRPGFSVGRGITWGKRNGWVTLDTRAILTGTSSDMRIEADFTFGIAATDKTKIILQLQGGMPSAGDAYLKFAPSVVWERKPGRFLELGLVTGIHNFDAYGVKFGIWREF